jgi:hypothetical protein
MVNLTPIFTSVIQSNTVGTTLANTSRTAPTNGATVYSAGTNGSLVNSILCKWNVTNAAGLVFLFTYDTTTYRLIGEFLTIATTVSATIPGFTLLIPLNYTLKSGYSLYVTNYLAETVNFFTMGSDY